MYKREKNSHEETTHTDKTDFVFPTNGYEHSILFLGGLNSFLDAELADVLKHGDAVARGEGAGRLDLHVID